MKRSQPVCPVGHRPRNASISRFDPKSVSWRPNRTESHFGSGCRRRPDAGACHLKASVGTIFHTLQAVGDAIPSTSHQAVTGGGERARPCARRCQPTSDQPPHPERPFPAPVASCRPPLIGRFLFAGQQARASPTSCRSCRWHWRQLARTISYPDYLPCCDQGNRGHEPWPGP